jgi:hypothetical protein
MPIKTAIVYLIQRCELAIYCVKRILPVGSFSCDQRTDFVPKVAMLRRISSCPDFKSPYLPLSVGPPHSIPAAGSAISGARAAQ